MSNTNDKQLQEEIRSSLGALAGARLHSAEVSRLRVHANGDLVVSERVAVDIEGDSEAEPVAPTTPVAGMILD